MRGPVEFHYRLATRTGGSHPGSHPGRSFGSAQEFALHARLFDYPDPRRLDLRASQRAVPPQWLVRLHLQRVAIPVYVVVDVSTSMFFGSERTKLDVAADFVESLGYSAFRAGDQVGMLAFDDSERNDLFIPARHGRGVAAEMAALLRGASASSRKKTGHAGIEQAFDRLAGRRSLLFLVSDFHWSLFRLEAALARFTGATMVPMVVWDKAEIEPPSEGKLLAVRDLESGRSRTVWLRPKVLKQWGENVAKRRRDLTTLFAKHGAHPFFVEGTFDGESLSRHFVETAV